MHTVYSLSRHESKFKDYLYSPIVPLGNKLYNVYDREEIYK